MHTHQDHMLDAPGFEDAPDFLAVVADVILLVDREGVGLRLPGGLRVAALRGEFSGPSIVFGQVVVLAAV